MTSEILSFSRAVRKPSWPRIDGASVPTRSACTRTNDTKGKQLYFELLSANVSPEAKASSRNYLANHLRLAEKIDTQLPQDLTGLEVYLEQQALQVGKQYKEYLQYRKAGGAKRFFISKSHALSFIKKVAPTKLVDGAWLYGMTHFWADMRFRPLIKIYLEELGEGQPAWNHVLIYKKLLEDLECGSWVNLEEKYFTQGAIQLALAQNTTEFLPEVIGFNLGYEQLPLHLPITAYELNELGIDPSYFSLHITIDNHASGHARKSIETALKVAPNLGDPAEYYRRVMNGYKLNMLGASSTSIIESFDLYDEVITIFKDKSIYGKNMHSDYCRFEGRSVNEWLSTPDLIPGFIQVLEDKGWINRNQNPENSRFWKLLDGDNAQMFGVFNAYEKQVIYEWIAGDFCGADSTLQVANGVDATMKTPTLSFRAKQRLASQQEDSEQASETVNFDFDPECLALEEKVISARSRAEIFKLLSSLISPSLHHTAVGLMATRIYASML